MAGMEIGPAVPNAEPRPEGGGLWDDWSEAVRAAPPYLMMPPVSAAGDAKL